MPQESRIKGCVRWDRRVGCDSRAYYITANVGNVIYSYTYIYIVICNHSCKGKCHLLKFLIRNIRPWKLRQAVGMEWVCQNIKQLSDLISWMATIICWAILKIGPHYIRSRLVGCTSFWKFSQCSDWQPRYWHLFPKSCDSLQSSESQHTSADSQNGWVYRGPSIQNRTTESRLLGAMQNWLLSISKEGDSAAFLSNLFTDLCTPEYFIQSRGFTEVTSICISSPHQHEKRKCADSKSSEIVNS